MAESDGRSQRAVTTFRKPI